MAHSMERLTREGPKRILALDGGGVRGAMTCAVLERMEDALRARLPEPEQERFRLCHYFDLIGGTSTGAIISAWLALGHTAAETRALYEELAKEVFSKGSLFGGLDGEEKFDSKRFLKITDEVFAKFGKDLGFDAGYTPIMGSPDLKTGLALFAKRIDRASPWIVHNHPHGKFWAPKDAPWDAYYRTPNNEPGTPNYAFDLRRFVQASASAPFYLDAIERTVAPDETATFIDGGVSPHNNPALQLFLMATLKWRDGERPSNMPDGAASPFGFGWETGADKLLLVSVGTGAIRKESTKGFWRSHAAVKAIHALTTMIDDANLTAITWLQALSKPLKPYWINYELEDMAGLRLVQEPLLSFTRIDAKLNAKDLERLLGPEALTTLAGGASDKKKRKFVEKLQKLDHADPKHIAKLVSIGDTLGAQYFAETKDAEAVLPPSFDPWRALA